MILSSGMAQVILIITTPIITRLYSPTEFGEFTIFSNIAMILIPIINARYDLLIVNTKNDRSANILSQISFLISLLILLILIPIFAISACLYPNFVLRFYFHYYYVVFGKFNKHYRLSNKEKESIKC